MNPKDFTWPVVVLASVIIIVCGGLLWTGHDVAVAGSVLSGVVVGLFTHAAGVSSQNQTLNTVTRVISAVSASASPTPSITTTAPPTVTAIGGDKA